MANLKVLGNYPVKWVPNFQCMNPFVRSVIAKMPTVPGQLVIDKTGKTVNTGIAGYWSGAAFEGGADPVYTSDNAYLVAADEYDAFYAANPILEQICQQIVQIKKLKSLVEGAPENALDYVKIADINRLIISVAGKTISATFRDENGNNLDDSFTTKTEAEYDELIAAHYDDLCVPVVQLIYSRAQDILANATDTE